MIIAVMSDTHGNRSLMFQAVEVMKQLGATLFFHLGDDYADAEELAMTEPEVRMVPGLWCRAYRDARVPNRIVEEVDGLAIAAVHAAKDLRQTEYSADIVLTGHTHEAAIERIGHTIYLNPGHLKGPESRGQRPSFALITLSDDAIHAAIHELTG
ncbi:MAG: YfcE family phosphodiesterase, partial [Candidatus Hydrogenedentes bacterium]|nr:YfcE family phosphodiesterase [Candidatus Hydrogenedentota bacterium]